MEALKVQNQELQGQLQQTSSSLLDVNAKLNDPTYIRNLYEQGAPAEEQDPQPEFEDIDAENMSSTDVVKEMTRRQNEMSAWHARQTDKKFKAREDQEQANQVTAARNAEAQKIRDFVATKDDFSDYQEDVRKNYGQPLSIEDAYEFAKLRKIASEATGPTHPRRQSMPSNRSAENETMNKKFDTVQEGARAALDEVLGDGFDESML